jgi:hypothetical protein
MSPLKMLLLINIEKKLTDGETSVVQPATAISDVEGESMIRCTPFGVYALIVSSLSLRVVVFTHS